MSFYNKVKLRSLEMLLGVLILIVVASGTFYVYRHRAESNNRRTFTMNLSPYSGGCSYKAYLDEKYICIRSDVDQYIGKYKLGKYQFAKVTATINVTQDKGYACPTCFNAPGTPMVDKEFIDIIKIYSIKGQDEPL
jgi:hypothetical protein